VLHVGANVAEAEVALGGDELEIGGGDDGVTAYRAS